MNCAGIGEDEVIRILASAESRSEHPLAAAVVELATTKGIALSEPTALEALPVRASTRRSMDTTSGSEREPRSRARLRGARRPDPRAPPGEGPHGLVGTIDGEPGGILALADTPKAAARDAIAELRRMRLRTLLVSGDARRVAEAVARELGIDEVRAEIRPDGKAEIVAELQAADTGSRWSATA